MNKVITIESQKLSVETLPDKLKEDGTYILTVLNDELKACLDELDESQLKTKFHACIHRRVNDYHDRLWEFRDTLKSFQSEFSAATRSSLFANPCNLLSLTAATMLVSYGRLPSHFQI